MKDAIIIFVRNPELGKVKTRLAKEIGDEQALQVYKQLLEHTHRSVSNVDCDRFVYYVDRITNNDLWEESLFQKKVQQGNDLGERMMLAFSELFDQGYAKIVIVGSDCFELNEIIINQAFESLQDNDVVIGPAKDGGYYLLGMKKIVTFIFENKEWSTPTVYNDTIADFKEQQLSFYVLPVLTDVDSEKDWLAAKKSIV